MRLRLLCMLLAAAVLTSCGEDSESAVRFEQIEDESEPAALTVAARNLIGDEVRELAEAFEDASPDVEVELQLDTTEELSPFIEGDDRADIYIDTIDQLDDFDTFRRHGRLVSLGEDIVQLVVAADNPLGIDDLTVFTSETHRTGLCDPEQRCGRRPADALESAGILPAPDLLAESASRLIEALVDDEIDATLLTRPHVPAGEEGITEIAIPLRHNQSIEWAASQLTNRPTAREFMRWLETSDDAEEILVAAGYRRR